MFRVLIQLIDSAGKVQSESTLIKNVTLEDAHRAMTSVSNATKDLRIAAYERCVTEFHYRDGDIGAYDGDDLASRLWAHFTKRHQPSHILIRPGTEEGQQLSNTYAVPRRWPLHSGHWWTRYMQQEAWFSVSLGLSLRQLIRSGLTWGLLMPSHVKRLMYSQ